MSANFCDIKVAESSDAPEKATQAVKDRIGQYIRKFSLSDECKTVLLEHLPNINNFARMEQDAILMYSIHMNDGTKYYLSVLSSKEPTCLQSSEEDYDSRTRYYDRFAKASDVDEPANEPAEEDEPFTVEHDEEYIAQREYIWKFLLDKGYEVQTVIGVPNIGRYEDDDPADLSVGWYAYLKHKGEWTEFVVMLFNGEVASVLPNRSK